MPYSIPAPTDPRPVTPAALSPDGDDALVVLLAQLRPAIEAAARAEDAAAQSAVQSSHEFGVLADAGRAVRDLWRTRDAAAATVSRDPNLSASGRNDGLARITAALDTGLGRIAASVMSSQGDALLAKYPPSPTPILAADLAPAASFVVTAAGAQLPAAFLAKAADVLSRAIDPTTSPADKFRLNQLLDAAYAPMLARFADSPPKYWQPWTGLAGDLAQMIDTHIDVTWQRARYRTAVEAVADMRQSFSWLVTMARENGTWDDVFFTGAPAFARAATP